jgi:competence protein ComGC
MLTLLSGLLFAGILIFVLFSAIVRSSGKLNLLSQMTSEKAITVRQTIVNAQKRRLMLALETYRLEKGSYPLSLEDLVQTGFILESDISYPFGDPYRIVWGDRGPMILPPGN